MYICVIGTSKKISSYRYGCDVDSAETMPLCCTTLLDVFCHLHTAISNQHTMFCCTSNSAMHLKL